MTTPSDKAVRLVGDYVELALRVRDGRREIDDMAAAHTRLLAYIAELEGRADGPQWQHERRGTTYTEIGRAELQAGQPVSEGVSLVVYRCHQTGKLWARSEAEFFDGRFAPYPFEGRAAQGEKP